MPPHRAVRTDVVSDVRHPIPRGGTTEHGFCVVSSLKLAAGAILLGTRVAWMPPADMSFSREDEPASGLSLAGACLLSSASLCRAPQDFTGHMVFVRVPAGSRRHGQNLFWNPMPHEPRTSDRRCVVFL